MLVASAKVQCGRALMLTSPMDHSAQPPAPRLLPCLLPSHPPPPPAQHPGSKEAAAIGRSMAADGKAQQELPESGIDKRSFSAGDLALLLLDAPIDSLAPVAMASPADWEAVAQPGLELRTVGWGATAAGSSPRNFPTLLQVSLRSRSSAI